MLLASSLAAAPFPHVRFWDFSGPRTVIAGNRSFFSTTPMLGFNFTVDPATDIFTVTGGAYTPVNGDIIVPDSSGVLPAGMYTIVNGVWPIYAVCDAGVGGAGTFHFKQTLENYVRPDPCTGPQLDVTDAGTGTHVASLYNSTVSIYLNSDPTGFPTGTTFTYMMPSGTSECNHAAQISSGGKTYSPNGQTICIIASVPSNATPGTMTTHITFCGTDTGTNCTTFDWVIEVVAPPNISYTPPSSFTSIPGLAYWEGVMVARPCPGSNCGSPGVPARSVSGPANFCDPLASPTVHTLGAATSSGVSFYGWNLLFDNMAIYTGNSVYRTGCFASGMGGPGGPDLQGVKYYVTNNNGAMIGYAHFTESLFRAARVFNDSSYSAAGLLMQNNYIIALGPKLGFSQMRENAYGLDDAVALKKYGNLATPHWTDVRDGLYSMVMRATESDASGVRFNQQGYQLGLAAHAIEADWQLTGDPRAPYALKRIADRIWADYDQTNHIWMNLEGPNLSPWCSNSVLWFLPNVDGNCGTRPVTWQALQMHAVHVFWWYYAYTGDTTYRDRGDDIFSHAFGQGYLDGKQSSEVYYNSFNAVGWRSGALQVNQWYGDAQTQAPTVALGPCDLNADGHVNVLDVQLGTNQALGTAICSNGDLNGDAHCTIVDVMRIVSASLGAACSTAP